MPDARKLVTATKDVRRPTGNDTKRRTVTKSRKAAPPELKSQKRLVLRWRKGWTVLKAEHQARAHKVM